MITKVFLLVVCASAAWSFPRTDGGDSQIEGSRIDDMDEMRANISAIWSEINRLSEMVNTHVQDGHHHHPHSHKSHDDNHHHHSHGNETMEEIDQLYEHSNHTHEVGHPHDDQHFHQEHSSSDHAGHHHRHTEERGHDHHHDDERGHGHHHDEERGHDHHHDDKRDHHLHDDSHEVDNNQVGHAHKTQSQDDNSDEDESRGSHPYKGKDHYQSHHHNPHESYGHHRHHHFMGRHQHYHSDDSGSAEYNPKIREGLIFKAPNIETQRHEIHRQPRDENEIKPHGSCVMNPNTDIPESRIVGNVVVLQRKYGKGPLYYKINLRGFSVGKDKTSRTHGFHIHEKALSGEGLCGSAGAHFNPTNQTHGPLSSKKRHLGDFGNIVVDKDGSLLDYEVTDHWNSLNNIIAKSFVIHELPDDLGKGGNPESLATGNAGRRLACCTIHAGIDMSIRFNG